MTLADVAILIPTKGRCDRLERVVANASHPNVAVYLIMEPDEAREVAGAATLALPPGVQGWPAAINHGYRNTKEPFLFAGADDVNFHEGWLEAALARMGGSTKVAGTNDLSGAHYVVGGISSPHFLVARDYLDTVGGVWDEGPGSFLHEAYKHCADTEFIDTAADRGVWQPCLESVVEHLHPFWDKGEEDDTYRLTMPHIKTDNALANHRYVLRRAHETRA